jgi:hypothetical protein
MLESGWVCDWGAASLHEQGQTPTCPTVHGAVPRLSADLLPFKCAASCCNACCGSGQGCMCGDVAPCKRAHASPPRTCMSDTDTCETPCTACSPCSTALVHAPHVMPVTRRRATCSSSSSSSRHVLLPGCACHTRVVCVGGHTLPRPHSKFLHTLTMPCRCSRGLLTAAALALTQFCCQLPAAATNCCASSCSCCCCPAASFHVKPASPGQLHTPLVVCVTLSPAACPPRHPLCPHCALT